MPGRPTLHYSRRERIGETSIPTRHAKFAIEFVLSHLRSMMHLWRRTDMTVSFRAFHEAVLGDWRASTSPRFPRDTGIRAFVSCRRGECVEYQIIGSSPTSRLRTTPKTWSSLADSLVATAIRLLHPNLGPLGNL